MNRVFIVKLDVDEDDRVRSLKIGSTGWLGHTGTFEPDRDWTIDYDAHEEGQGWVLRPKKPLDTGEYGLYVMTGELYEFAVR